MTKDYDALTQLLQRRHSCRSFSPEPVSDAVLQKLSEAFSLAPQAGGGRHLQCRFITDQAAIQNLAVRGREAFVAFCQSLPSPFVREKTAHYGENFFWFGDVPTLAVVTCRKAPTFLEELDRDRAQLIWGGELSAAMASFSLLLGAETLGLGACCLTGSLLMWREMESLLGVSRRDRLICLVALGHKSSPSPFVWDASQTVGKDA